MIKVLPRIKVFLMIKARYQRRFYENHEAITCIHFNIRPINVPMTES